MKNKLLNIFKDKEYIGHIELLKLLTSNEIKKCMKNKLIESNHAEYDMAEPSYKLLIK